MLVNVLHRRCLHHSASWQSNGQPNALLEASLLAPVPAVEISSRGTPCKLLHQRQMQRSSP